MFEQWVAMEQFYYVEFAWMLVIAIVIAIILISIIFYLNRLIPRILLSAGLIVYIIMGLILYQNFTKYGDLIDKTQYVNAAVRDYKRSFFNMDQHYLHSEKQLYRIGHLEETYESLGLYDAVPVEETVEYRGNDGQGTHYIAMNNRSYAVNERWVTFTNDTEQAVRSGTRYELEDGRFSEIGFVASSRVLFNQYYIPAAAEDLTADEAAFDNIYPHTDDLIEGWIAP